MAASSSSPSRRRGAVDVRAADAKTAGSAAEWVEANLGHGRVVKEKFLGGSNWSSAYAYTTEAGAELFVKLALKGRDDSMFQGEAKGLQAMHATKTLRVPQVHHVGSLPGGRGSFIVMEHLNLGGRAGQAELGRQLARMHQAEPSDPNAAAGKFGFCVDNTIGGTPQPNGWTDDWVDFYRERRLKHQLRLLGDRRLSQLGDKLCDSLGDFFTDVQGSIKPSTLHGDLWSGNIASVDGAPCVFDPATYYGHAEAEFGMAWCAGFTGEFYRAYHEVLPPAPQFERRRPLYELYHILNHANLFGGGYESQALRIMEGLVAQL